MDKSLFKCSLSVDYLENCHGIKFDLRRVHELSAFIRPRGASPTIDILCDQIITSASRRTSWNVSTASKKDLVNYQISHICLVHSLKHHYCLLFSVFLEESRARFIIPKHQENGEDHRKLLAVIERRSQEDPHAWPPIPHACGSCSPWAGLLNSHTCF